MKTVFILGAGASQPAGAPLMKDFLDRARELARNRAASIDISAFELVTEALKDLQAVRQKSSLDLENVEAVFSAVEMGSLIGKLPGRKAGEISQLRDALVTVIVQTIERTMPFQVEEGQILPPGNYGEFAELVEELKTACRSVDDPLALITFNYDLGVDYALHQRGLPFSYGLTQDTQRPNQVPLLKLHGSINWGLCNNCHQIVPFHVRDAHFDLWPEHRTVYFNLGTVLPQTKHCDSPLSRPPVLVPPTWDKSRYHRQVEAVWKNAASQLAEAENVFVIGYSLPDSDLFFRYLFALGSESRTLVDRFWVFNPDPDGSVRSRFESFIGPSLTPRFKFFSNEDGLFWRAIRTIQAELLS